VEGTAAAFFNTFKTQASCPNVKNIFEDPCSLSVENGAYGWPCWLAAWRLVYFLLLFLKCFQLRSIFSTDWGPAVCSEAGVIMQTSQCMKCYKPVTLGALGKTAGLCLLAKQGGPEEPLTQVPQLANCFICHQLCTQSITHLGKRKDTCDIDHQPP
jgi:hypothetical protein